MVADGEPVAHRAERLDNATAIAANKDAMV